METKQKILEGLDGYKRTEKVNGLINKATNHLFDAYRALEMAISHCDDPNLRRKLEVITEKIGKGAEVAGFIDSEKPTIISDLQDMMNEIKID